MSDLLIGFFLLLFSCKGSSQEVGPSQTIRAMVGDDIVLPCLLRPPKDATHMTVEWGRPDLEPRFVFVRHEGKEHLVHQNQAYRGRSSVWADKLKDGDVSLRLSDVRHSDSGRYRCYVPKHTQEDFVELLVGSVSSAGIRLAGLDEGSSGVMLDCQSAGWFPEPQLLWLDGEGQVLPAGPAETSRGPDGLYSVSSRVTVEKRANNNFTCRVQQKDMEQSRETHVHVPEDFFVVRSNCSVPVSLALVFFFILIFLVSVSVWRWRQRKTSTQKQPEDGNEEQGQLMEERKGDLTENRSEREEELLKIINKHEEREEELLKVINKHEEREEELLKINSKHEESLDHITEVFMKIKEEMEEHKKQITALQQEEEKIIEENEKNIKEVEQDIENKKGDKSKNLADGYIKLKKIMTQDKSKLGERTMICQQLDLNTDKLIQKMKEEMKRMKENKQKRLK